MAKSKKEPTMNADALERMRLEIENRVLREMLTKGLPVSAQTTPAQTTPVPTPERKKRSPRVQAAKPEPVNQDPNANVDWTKVMHTCPGPCGETKPVVPHFGLRKVRGITYQQSLCKACRSKAAQLTTSTTYRRKRPYVKRGSVPTFERSRSYSPRKP